METNSGVPEKYLLQDKDYINERVDYQILWFSKLSKQNKLLHYIFSFVEIIAALSIPVLIQAENLQNVENFASILAVTVAACASLKNLYQFKEDWVRYRTTAELLKHEKYLYLTRSEIYARNDDNHFDILVDRIEKILLAEQQQWTESTKRGDADVKGKQR